MTSHNYLRWLLAVIAVIVTIISFQLGGAHEAVLDSVRFSGLVFAAALSARAAGSRFHSAQRELTIAFALAHYVHFAAVAALIYLDADHPLHNMRGTITMSGGVMLITLLLSGTIRGWTKLAALGFYVSGTLLLIAFASRSTVRPISAVMVAVLVCALVYRVAKRRADGIQAASA